MSHSFNKIWLHVIFGTKNRLPFISSNVEEQIHEHMRQQLIEDGCRVKIINGMPDHVHLLFLQNPKMAIMDIVRLVKGNTSHWINQEDLIIDKFAWQTGYAGYSVSESQLKRVYDYIKNQKSHHSNKTFEEEYNEFISAHGLIKNEYVSKNKL
jgi:putative transposase